MRNIVSGSGRSIIELKAIVYRYSPYRIWCILKIYYRIERLYLEDLSLMRKDKKIYYRIEREGGLRLFTSQR